MLPGWCELRNFPQKTWLALPREQKVVAEEATAIDSQRNSPPPSEEIRTPVFDSDCTWLHAGDVVPWKDGDLAWHDNWTGEHCVDTLGGGTWRVGDDVGSDDWEVRFGVQPLCVI